MLSQPQPLLPENGEPLFPPQQHSNRMIHNRLLQLLLSPQSHPQFVAAKSLIVKPPFCFYNYILCSVLVSVSIKEKYFQKNIFTI